MLTRLKRTISYWPSHKCAPCFLVLSRQSRALTSHAMAGLSGVQSLLLRPANILSACQEGVSPASDTARAKSWVHSHDALSPQGQQALTPSHGVDYCLATL